MYSLIISILLYCIKNYSQSNKNLLYRLRECSDVYEFDSDGLDFYIPERTDNNRFIEKIHYI